MGRRTKRSSGRRKFILVFELIQLRRISGQYLQALNPKGSHLVLSSAAQHLQIISCEETIQCDSSLIDAFLLPDACCQVAMPEPEGSESLHGISRHPTLELVMCHSMTPMWAFLTSLYLIKQCPKLNMSFNFLLPFFQPSGNDFGLSLPFLSFSYFGKITREMGSLGHQTPVLERCY